MIETHRFEVTGGATLTIEPRNMEGQRFSDGHRNIQVTVSGLGGGSYSVSYRSVGSDIFTEHVNNATEVDTVMIAGKRAPVCDAIKITFANVPAQTSSKITLNTWPRGL